MFEVVPRLSVKEEFNSNIFFAGEDEIDDWITTLSPGLDVRKETERLFAGLGGRLDVVRFLDNTDLSATEKYGAGRLRYRLSPRTDLAAGGEYAKDFRPDRDILDTGLVQSAQPRWRRSFNLSGQYRTSETAAETIRYGYQESDYQAQDFADSVVQTLDLGHTWNAGRVLERTLGRLGLGYARGDFETSTLDSYSATLGGSWQASEVLSLVLDLGVRHTRTTFLTTLVDASGQTVQSVAETSDWTGIVEAELQYRGETGRSNLTLAHDIRQASGRGGTTQRSSAVFWLSRRFSDKFEGKFFAGYYRNKSEQAAVSVLPVDEHTVRIQPALQFDFTRDIFLQVAYTLTWVKDNADDTEAAQNIVFGRLQWQWPLLE
jgi:hypothetical protein